MLEIIIVYSKPSTMVTMSRAYLPIVGDALLYNALIMARVYKPVPSWPLEADTNGRRGRMASIHQLMPIGLSAHHHNIILINLKQAKSTGSLEAGYQARSVCPAHRVYIGSSTELSGSVMRRMMTGN